MLVFGASHAFSGICVTVRQGDIHDAALCIAGTCCLIGRNALMGVRVAFGILRTAGNAARYFAVAISFFVILVTDIADRTSLSFKGTVFDMSFAFRT